MAMKGDPMGHGTMLAIGIVLLWFSGLMFFIAFMGGKSPSLSIGKDQNGNPVGPANVSDLVARAAANVQALEGGVIPTAPQGGVQA